MKSSITPPLVQHAAVERLAACETCRRRCEARRGVAHTRACSRPLACGNVEHPRLAAHRVVPSLRPYDRMSTAEIDQRARGAVRPFAALVRDTRSRFLNEKGRPHSPADTSSLVPGDCRRSGSVPLRWRSPSLSRVRNRFRSARPLPRVCGCYPFAPSCARALPAYSAIYR